MSLFEIFVKSNMMIYMTDDEIINKYFFLCKEKQFKIKRKNIISKKCSKKLYYIFEEYNDFSKYNIFLYIQTFPKYINDLINLCFENTPYNNNVNSYIINDGIFLKNNNNFYIKIKNNIKITKNDFYIKKKIFKNNKINCNNKFYWTYRLKFIIQELILKDYEYLQFRALIY